MTATLTGLLMHQITALEVSNAMQDLNTSIGIGAPVVSGLASTLLDSQNSKQQQRRRLANVTIINDSQKGSGVILANSSKARWIVTNRHVVGDSRRVCVVFEDGLSLAATVRYLDPDYDLAFLDVPSMPTKYRSISIETSQVGSGVEPVIVTGYMALTGEYVESRGVSIPMLQNKRLKSGYDMTYSGEVGKGMSGGGIFSIDNKLVGINAIHSEPLWSGNWYYENGSEVGAKLTRKLDSVNVGISSDLIAKALRNIKKSGGHFVDSIKCKRRTV